MTEVDSGTPKPLRSLSDDRQLTQTEEASMQHDFVIIRNTLEGPLLEDNWQICLAEMDNLPEEQAKASIGYVRGLRDRFVSSLRDVDDAEDLETCVSLFYIQVKSQWILYNTQYGYQLAHGVIDPYLVCTASLLSGLLGAFEPLLDPAVVAGMNQFLSAPNAHLPGAEAIRELEDRVQARDEALCLWEPLRELHSGRSVREIVEHVRGDHARIDDARRTLERAEAMQADFLRAFGGLTPRQVSEQIERMERTLQQRQEEARTWFEGRATLTDAFGVADPAEIVRRYEEIKALQVEQALELARLRQERPETPAEAPDELPRNSFTNLDDILVSLEDAMKRLAA